METREDDDRMLHASQASAYHWAEAPECEPKNRARSEWQVSRVYAVLGRGEPALWHAERCLDLEEARRSKEQTLEAADAIGDAEDREHVHEALEDL